MRQTLLSNVSESTAASDGSITVRPYLESENQVTATVAKMEPGLAKLVHLDC
jgi:hypothetical protein